VNTITTKGREEDTPQVKIGPFSLNVQEGWTLTTVIIAGPSEDDIGEAGERPFQRNLVATMESVHPEETPEQYVERQLAGLWKAGVEQYLDEREQVTLKGDLKGLLHESVIIGTGGERVRQMQLVCIKESVAYTLIASDLDGERFNAARQQFREMLLSFS
jgi:hypothetical protein